MSSQQQVPPLGSVEQRIMELLVSETDPKVQAALAALLPRFGASELLVKMARENERIGREATSALAESSIFADILRLVLLMESPEASITLRADALKELGSLIRFESSWKVVDYPWKAARVRLAAKIRQASTELLGKVEDPWQQYRLAEAILDAWESECARYIHAARYASLGNSGDAEPGDGATGDRVLLPSETTASPTPWNILEDFGPGLKSENPIVRLGSAYVYVACDDPRGIDVLVEVLADPDPALRGHAALLLRNCALPGASAELVMKALEKEQDPLAVARLASALQQWQNPAALGALVERLETAIEGPDEQLVSYAKVSLANAIKSCYQVQQLSFEAF